MIRPGTLVVGDASMLEPGTDLYVDRTNPRNWELFVFNPGKVGLVISCDDTMVRMLLCSSVKIMKFPLRFLKEA
jgi:hypothetical protein